MEDTGTEQVYPQDEASTSKDDMQGIDDVLKMLTKLDWDTACILEKLVNLHILLMHMLASDNDLEAMAMTDSAELIEEVLVFDLLCGILESELIEVYEFLDLLDAQIIYASSKISLFRRMEEAYAIMGGKLQDSAESLRQSRGQVSEITLQLAQLQKTLRYIKNGNSENDGSMEIPRNSKLKDISGKLRRRKDLKKRRVLRMLEKSLSRELDLGKELSEFGQNEEQLKLKLHNTEQAASRMEEASEVIWGRFLEADNASEVLMGISKELVGRLQIVQFNLNGSVRRESELRSSLEDCMEQIRAKDLRVQKLETSNAENMKIFSEVLTTRENVKSVEEKLRNTELELKSANSSKQEILVQLELAEMENVIQSLKDSLLEAETRAESGETKIKELTATNLELTEEINFLKEADSTKSKKVSLLEKQLRESETQLQNSKVSSDASQERQNMLYSTIWDMETLIEDLKSKVSKAENKTEAVEQQYIVLSETNFELNKDLSFLREKVESLEALLDQANHEKEKRAKEINGRSKLLMDMVMQLATERERIKGQLYSLAKENELLRDKLCSTGLILQTAVSYAGDCTEKELHAHTNSCKIEAFSKSLQEDELTKDEPEANTEPDPSVSDDASTDSNHKAAESTSTSSLRPIRVIAVVLVLILSFFALILFK